MTVKYYTHGRRDQMKVALTFDDGPNPPRTDQVIEILDSYGAHGTFFVLGKWVERFPQAFQRIIEGGHAVGNHSHLHLPHLGDFDRAEAAIGNLLGRPTRYLRAHYFNFFTCLYSPVALAPEMKIVDADVNPADYETADPQAIVDATLNHPALAAGSIIDLHDSTESDDDALRLARPLPMIQALPAIIEGLQAKGYQLVSLDQMELVDPVEWQYDGRGTFATAETRRSIASLKGS